MAFGNLKVAFAETWQVSGAGGSLLFAVSTFLGRGTILHQEPSEVGRGGRTWRCAGRSRNEELVVSLTPPWSFFQSSLRDLWHVDG